MVLVPVLCLGNPKVSDQRVAEKSQRLFHLRCTVATRQRPRIKVMVQLWSTNPYQPLISALLGATRVA